jgi:transcriptional regulator with XRE-family HTH domain
MPRTPLESLGAMVKVKRGERRLREAAAEIGIGVATLMRVENGRIPDVATFGKLCRWLEVDPGTFLGFERKRSAEGPALVTLSAHLKADPNPNPETVRALAQMLSLVAKTQAQEASVDDGPGSRV